MKKTLLIIVALVLSFNISCKSDKKETETATDNVETETPTATETKKTTSEPYVPTDVVKKVTVKLEAKSESNVTGNALFKEEKGVVTMIAVFDGLTEGSHAIHLHEKADCSSADGTSTGGHWNPTAQPHGKWGDDKGYHKGDIGNFSANANGKGTVTFSTDQWCIGCGDDTKDILGKAVIVHQGTDDFTSQPSGAAGSRVSCGGIIE
ncbi:MULTISPECIES: superoxide dismutase family protein [Flavobacteriaceae]|uniref:Cu-Zn family superoxide dismutase n=1 Tax=Meridianimaribacter flavus TaxID=571115 RepID=A0ABY2G6B6_9FLAO|nr:MULTISPECIES: superoxide dismutase family protein [Flavobacteriaceae]TBV25548.1 superoxide dismutase family protein [Meridianimaribacter sp. CL38]TDY11824.1 Cu-Zn family superoxide dismutase [Meridianimaribacter flavus]